MREAGPVHYSAPAGCHVVVGHAAVRDGLVHEDVVTDFPLTDGQMERLSAASHRTAPYPGFLYRGPRKGFARLDPPVPGT
ncbi:hypothetical protein GCM10009801_49860 [Streptomyces albiaxialis]|uniref:Uncharacterized protein n=2 Tax=Streptomyces albiaxialis TaxID=329523 RepID=A0ABN2W9X5_9ACTN